MNTEAAEDTPLLAEQSWALEPAAQTLRNHGLQGIFIQDISLAFTVEDPRKLSFVLSVLLYLRQNLIHERHKNKGPYERWSQEQTKKTDIDMIEETIKELWDLFLDSPRDIQIIELVLWQRFPVVDLKSKTMRVVDFLATPKAPQHLVCHPVVVWSLSKVWKQGVTALDRNVRSWAKRYDTYCTPRIVHSLDVISDLSFLALVIHILNDPSIFPQAISGRETTLFILIAGGLFRPRSAHRLSYALAALAFLFSIPNLPMPGQTPFMLFNISMGLQILELHFAQYPSPLYFFPVDWSLPLALFIRRKIAQGIIPVVLYLFPVFLFSSYLLSLSLADTFLRLDYLDLAVLAPAPFQTRIAYLIFSSSVIVIAAICTIILITPDYPGTAADRWDRFSPFVGYEARTVWLRTVVAYSDPDLFPSPLTLVHILQLLSPSSNITRCVQGLIRRIIVGPFALVIYLVYALFRV